MIVICCISSCKNEKKAKNESTTKDTVIKKSGLVEIVAKDFKFYMPDTLKSGWNTIDFDNQGHAEHFYFLNKVPESISLDQYLKSVTQPFQVVLDSLNHHTTKEKAVQMLGELIAPFYFSSTEVFGGCGIVSPKLKTQNTINLVPGNYMVECYIKEKGIFHGVMGMTKQVIVSAAKSSTPEPKANYSIELTNHNIESKGQLQAGKNIVAVHFKEQPEFGLGNDVQLIKLEKNTNIDNVITWLDWMNIGGLEPKAPVTFLGGVQEMEVGNTAYFTVNLKPGNYAWIAESYAAQGMVKKFSIE